MKHKEVPLSAVINDISEHEERWFAVHTKYKCEKYVAEQLAKKDIATYLPLKDVTKRYVSRVKKYQVPLINCYVFVKILKAQYVPVLETEYVFSFLKQRKNIIAIPDAEIDMLKRIVGEITDVEAAEISLEHGDIVEIIAGNLTGIKGRLIEKLSKNNFVVELTTIGIQLAMTIDRSNLRLLQKSTA